jgi:hypothetical protein
MSEPKPKLLRTAGRASDIPKGPSERVALVQRIDTGLLIGHIGTGVTGGVGFCPDGVEYLLTAQALREIADMIDIHGLELAS